MDFRGLPRSNRTHRSTTDPEALLARKSNAAPAKLSYAGHVLMENRSALIVDMELTQADGRAEREAAAQILGRLPARRRRRTVAADKAYDTAEFVATCRTLQITPHLAQNTTSRASAIDGRTTRHVGHRISQRIRKRIEEPFGRIKTVARAQAPVQGPKAKPGMVPDRRSRLQRLADHRAGRPTDMNRQGEAAPTAKGEPQTGLKGTNGRPDHFAEGHSALDQAVFRSLLEL